MSLKLEKQKNGEPTIVNRSEITDAHQKELNSTQKKSDFLFESKKIYPSEILNLTSGKDISVLKLEDIHRKTVTIPLPASFHSVKLNGVDLDGVAASENGSLIQLKFIELGSEIETGDALKSIPSIFDSSKNKDVVKSKSFTPILGLVLQGRLEESYKVQGKTLLYEARHLTSLGPIGADKDLYLLVSFVHKQNLNSESNPNVIIDAVQKVRESISNTFRNIDLQRK